ncbi:MAG TPA: cupin domain-containing protein, partial [Isosphaeraceae bacterium]|nr:cupin domain-containing protein [Isosphaeraceae bacterium]
MPSKVNLLSLAVAFAMGSGLALALAHSSREAKDPAKDGDHAPRRTEVLSQALPKGDFRKVAAVTVEYAAGGESPKHRHDVAVFAYVLQGSVESQLEGEKLKVFKQGEMWYEPPGTVHVVAR